MSFVRLPPRVFGCARNYSRNLIGAALAALLGGLGVGLRPLATDDWLLVHGVHLHDDHGLAGTFVHNPRSNMNNSVGYARPARFANPVALGTDGIGADMLDEFRVAYARHREDDVTASPEAVRKADAISLGSRTILMPLPPPPAAALIAMG